jgi:alanine racemase
VLEQELPGARLPVVAVVRDRAGVVGEPDKPGPVGVVGVGERGITRVQRPDRRAADQSIPSPSAVFAGATQTFSTPSLGAIHTSWVPSGDIRGLIRSGLPKITCRGMSSTMLRAYHVRADLAGPARCLRGRAGGRPAAWRRRWRLAGRPARGLLAHWDVMDGHPEALIDLGAIKENVSALRRHVGAPQLMAVVKADGYGHGMIPAARAAVAGGASWLGVVQIGDALALRQAGLTVPVLCLLGAPDAAHEDAIRGDVDLSAGSVALVGQIAAAAQRAGRPARLHLKADTGMSRGGATAEDWPALVAAALAARAAGHVQVTGIWSHLACADIPGHPATDAQLAAFRDAVELAARAGATPEVRHLANTPATLTRPDTWFDLVRPGGAVVGLSTLLGDLPAWLRPAMTLRARLVLAKQVPPGTGVSYGHRHVTASRAALGLVPLGYAEGVPRNAGGVAEVQVRGRRWVIAGTVCMNQFVLDFGEAAVSAGDEVVLFGPGDSGEPTAQQWADALGTISYEIVTRFAGRVPKSYSGVTEAQQLAESRTASA